MARKAKRKPPRRRLDPAAAPRPAPAPAGGPAASGAQAAVRAVEMSLAPGRPATRRPGRIVLEGGDPAIPLDRVPHFLSDLVRLGIVAAVMVLLLIAGAQVIPVVVR